MWVVNRASQLLPRAALRRFFVLFLFYTLLTTSWVMATSAPLVYALPSLHIKVRAKENGACSG